MNQSQLITAGLVAASAVGAAIVTADPVTLGLSPVVHAWVAIGMAGVAAVLAFRDSIKG